MRSPKRFLELPFEMADDALDRSIRFAAFLIGGALFLAFAIEYLVGGVIDLIVDCTNSSFSAGCSGDQVWQALAPVIGGAVLAFLAILFFVLAYRPVRATAAPFPPPPPPPP